MSNQQECRRNAQAASRGGGPYHRLFTLALVMAVSNTGLLLGAASASAAPISATPARAAQGGAAGEPEKVRIRDEELPVWPAENLRGRGFVVESIPREKNAAWIYIEAANAYDDMPLELSEAMDYAVSTAWPGDDSGIKEFLALPGNKKALDAVRRATELERCQMPYFGSPDESVIGILLPNLSHMRHLAKLMTAKARQLESEGKYDEALTHYFCVLRMGVHAAEGITLIEGLVGLAVWHVGSDALTDLVLREKLSAAQLDRLHRFLEEQAPHMPSVKRGLATEQAFGPALVDEVFSSPFFALGNLATVAGLNGADGSGLPAIGGSYFNIDTENGWNKLEQRMGRLFFPDRAIKAHMAAFYALQKAYAESPFNAEQMGANEARYLDKVPEWDVFTRTVAPSLTRAVSLSHSHHAKNNLLRTAVALAKYQQTAGEWPKTLAALGHRLPAGAAADPYDAAGLHYRSDGKSWVLYSIGPNLVDDGGQVAERWDQLDLAIRFPPEPIEPFVDPNKKTDTSDKRELTPMP